MSAILPFIDALSDRGGGLILASFCRETAETGVGSDLQGGGAMDFSSSRYPKGLKTRASG